MHSRFLVLASLLACTGLAAQTVPVAPQAPAPAQGESRSNQKVERIRIEDGGSRIDEVRYGGQTQSIVVQPKADVPEYEIQPTDLSRSRPGDHRDGMGNATGQRVWNVFKF